MAATQSPSSQTWAETRGANWRDQLDPMEAMLTPIDTPLIAALNLADRLRIAEIGAGGGATTRAIAAAATPGSTIEGFDISPDLIEAAKARVGSVARFTLADVAVFRPAERFDRLASPPANVKVPAFAFPDLIEDLHRPIARDGAGMVEVGVRLQKALASLQAIAFEAAQDCQREATDALERASSRCSSRSDCDRLQRVHTRYWNVSLQDAAASA